MLIETELYLIEFLIEVILDCVEGRIGFDLAEILDVRVKLEVLFTPTQAG